MKNEPLRTCVVCRKQAPQKQLMRLARQKDGPIVFNHKGGRGVYLCVERSCLDRLRSHPKLQKYVLGVSGLPEPLFAIMQAHVDHQKETPSV